MPLKEKPTRSLYISQRSLSYPLDQALRLPTGLRPVPDLGFFDIMKSSWELYCSAPDNHLD